MRGTVVLAQLTDIFDRSTWNLIIAAGLSAPIVSLAISNGALKRPIGASGGVVLVYYLVALLLAVPVFGGTQSPGLVCAFFVLMPVGVLIGGIVLLGQNDREPPEDWSG
jgi:hypothetical protein